MLFYSDIEPQSVLLFHWTSGHCIVSKLGL